MELFAGPSLLLMNVQRQKLDDQVCQRILCGWKVCLQFSSWSCMEKGTNPGCSAQSKSSGTLTNALKRRRCE